MDLNEPRFNQVRQLLAAMEALAFAMVNELRDNLGFDNADVNIKINADYDDEEFTFSPDFHRP